MINNNNNNNDRSSNDNNENNEITIVNCTTSKGDIGIELYQEWSPIGYEHAITLFNIGYYNNNHFHRIVSHSFIQFGITYNHDQYYNQPILDDPIHIPTIPCIPGTIAFAGDGIHSRTTQLYISLQSDHNFGTESWETPIGRITYGIENLYKLYSNYGDISPWGNGPNQDKIYEEGISYIEKNFPKLDYIIQCSINNNNNNKNNNNKRQQRNNNNIKNNIVASSINRHTNNKQKRRSLTHQNDRVSTKKRTTHSNNKNNNIHKIIKGENVHIIDEDHHAKLRKANHHDNHHFNEHDVHYHNNYNRLDHHHTTNNKQQQQQYDHLEEQHEHQRHHIHLHDHTIHDGEHHGGHINHNMIMDRKVIHESGPIHVGITTFSWELLSICLLLFSAVLGLWLTFVFGSSSSSSNGYGFYKKKVRKTQ